MRYAQIVVGPAGVGKSTYCAAVQRFGQDTNRNIKVVNLDPAAEHFAYEPYVDVRDIIQVDDVMGDDLNYGPNGGLVFCMEYLMQHDGAEKLKEELGDLEDDYILFDCPGQIELYTHLDVMKNFSELLTSWNFRLCGVFLLDSQYMVDTSKFLSGTLAALSCMMKLELPQINLLTKTDLLDKKSRGQLDMFLDPSVNELLSSDHCGSKFNAKFHKLTTTFATIIDRFSLVGYAPLNIKEEESIQNALLMIDSRIQYGEDMDVKTKDFDYEDPEEPEENNLYEN